MASYHILQTNINHCARAQDLLIQSLAHWNILVAVVAEPYFIPPKDNWAGDIEDTVAIIYSGTADFLSFEKKAKGPGYVAVLLGDTMFIGVYFSPKKNLADFETFLDKLSDVIRRSYPHPMVISGDFNARGMGTDEQPFSP